MNWCECFGGNDELSYSSAREMVKVFDQDVPHSVQVAEHQAGCCSLVLPVEKRGRIEVIAQQLSYRKMYISHICVNNGKAILTIEYRSTAYSSTQEEKIYSSGNEELRTKKGNNT
jgi:hypothetical protein